MNLQQVKNYHHDTIIILQYLPPAHPNDIPIHDVSMEVHQNNWRDIVNTTYYLTIMPSTCDYDIPLINITLLDVENSTGTCTVHGITMTSLLHTHLQMKELWSSS